MYARALLDMDVRPSYDVNDVARWTGGVWSKTPAFPVSGVSIDTRTLKNGELFVAIRGEHSDGHAYLNQAAANGAAAVVVEDQSALSGISIPSLVVPSTRDALTALARGYRSTWLAKVVAVTGSVGKTTVKELIADMLHHVGITSRTPGNWNNDLGVPLSILASRPDTQFGVFEVGMNHPGELDPLCELLAPDVSVVTCVGPVHIENFETEEGIAHEKASVYRALSGEGAAIINRDDAYAEAMIKQAGSNRIVTVSAGSGGDFVYRRVDPAHGRFILFEKSTGETVDCEAALPGAYFVLDASMAAATARALGVGWAIIRSAIRQYRPLAMRWNRDVSHGVHIINDAYNANPVSMRAAMQALMEEHVAGQRWLLLGGMLELGADERKHHYDLGGAVAALPEINLVTTGRRGEWIAQGARDAGMESSRVYATPGADAAADLLHEKLQPGDAILLKGSRGEAVEMVLKKWSRLKDARIGTSGSEG